MKKRILSIILLVCMIAVFCPIPAQAETPLEIWLPAPVAGATPCDETSVSFTKLSGLVLEQFLWFEEGNYSMFVTDPFQKGKTYLVSLYFEYPQTPDLSVTVNGFGAYVRWVDTNLFEVRYVFPMLPPDPLTFASVTITPPSIGAKPDYNPVLPAGAHYYSDTSWSASTSVNDVVWFDETAERYLDTTDTFIAGHEYSVWIDLTPETGYEFSIGSTAKVNGKTAYAEIRENSDDICYLRISYSFPALSSLPDGWLTVDGKYIYIKSGVMQTGWLWVPKQGSYFYLDPLTGAWTGWVFYKNNMYFYDTSTGSFKTGWLLENGNLYYFNPATCAMMTGWVYEGGKFYYFSPSTGALQVGWVWVPEQETYFYIDPSTGAWTGWLYYHGNTYFYDTALGTFKGGWLSYNGYWFYLNPSTGIMVTGTQVIGGKTYQFNSYGVCIG